ncbi:hypothetical protein [Lysobacter enzymogenes]|uniref:hypothetical protein n=1 Tax=Lysobacter enzymogenes TaxID=69 RepID=UPI000942AEB7|nr:hypothetical protein [Lysobacter enzymogenes]
MGPAFGGLFAFGAGVGLFASGPGLEIEALEARLQVFARMPTFEGIGEAASLQARKPPRSPPTVIPAKAGIQGFIQA